MEKIQLYDILARKQSFGVVTRTVLTLTLGVADRNTDSTIVLSSTIHRSEIKIKEAGRP